MKLLSDFIPIILFFVAYKLFGIYWATGVAIAATSIQVGISYWRNKKVNQMQVLTLVLIIIFGGATIVLHNPMFIKWKVSVINWLFAVVFIGSQFIGKKTVVQRLLEMTNPIDLPKTVWTKLNLSWAIFFASMGFINLYVIYHFDTNDWVNFKLFGMLALTLVFVVGQAIYLSRHISHD